ncbi:hypothetical protein V8C43DRAFT_325744 [Trichoderma afarasin]
MTADLSVAAQIGASIAAGAVVEAGWGAVSNKIDGNPITFGSVLKDALVGGLTGAFTEFGVRAMTGGFKAAGKVAFSKAVKSATKGAFQGLAFYNTAVAPVMALATGSWPLVESLVPSLKEIASARSGKLGSG